MDVKELTSSLLQEEFRDSLVEVSHWGPHEDEDLDVTVVLKEEPSDLAERDWRIYRRLREAGFNVLIGYDISDGQ
jgi:hypothetical protein